MAKYETLFAQQLRLLMLASEMQRIQDDDKRHMIYRCVDGTCARVCAPLLAVRAPRRRWSNACTFASFVATVCMRAAAAVAVMLLARQSR